MAIDIFLDLDGVKGESTDSVYKDKIELSTFSYGVSNTATIGSGTGGAGGGKCNLGVLTVTKTADISSPVIFQKCASGTHYKKATLICRKAGGNAAKPGMEYFRIEFGTVFVTDYSHVGTPGDDGLQETISFAYGAIKEAYQAQKPDGTMGGKAEFGWSQIYNKEAKDVTA